jgi:hypothetical protein
MVFTPTKKSETGGQCMNSSSHPIRDTECDKFLLRQAVSEAGHKNIEFHECSKPV